MSLRESFIELAIQKTQNSSYVLATGSKSKTGLYPSEEFEPIETTPFSEILQYEKTEYTFTALAGTPISLIEQMLDDNNQYMPFDPVLADKGATIGGALASGLNGSQRFRHGGIRDFALEVNFVDGRGDLVRAGGKVVKNAAGFDLPKFFSGSNGRFGTIVDATFKVFPKPKDNATVVFQFTNIRETIQALYQVTRRNFEFHAVDILPSCELIIRLSGETIAIEKQLGEIDSLLGKSGQRFNSRGESSYWRSVSNFGEATFTGSIANFADAENNANGEDRQSFTFLKIPCLPAQIEQLQSLLETSPAKTRYGVGGNLCWAKIDNQQYKESADTLSQSILEMGLSGQVIFGDANPKWLGKSVENSFFRKVKRALDPENRLGNF